MIEKMKVQPVFAKGMYSIFIREQKAKKNIRRFINKKKVSLINKKLEPRHLELESQNIGNIIFYQNKDL